MREKRVEHLLKEEYGSSYKQEGSIKAALVFPNSYYLGMSSLGFQVILDEINQHPDVSCERVFFCRDTPDSVPRSLETGRPLSDFDIVGFSISFELDYFNVVRILNAAKITLRAKDRGLHDPFIIAGGICSSFNPEPLSDFVDAFVVGDGEEVIHDLLTIYEKWWRSQDSRRDLHHRLSEIRGIYIPLLYEISYREDGTVSGISPESGAAPRIERATVGLEGLATASKILTSNTEFADFFLIEIMRGCAHRCRFCVASFSQKCRIRSKEAVLKLTRSKLAQKAERIGLVGSSVTDHPQIGEIAASLVDMGNRISIASVRADTLNDALLDALAASGQKTITLAPEAASDRLKNVIGKDISLEATFEAVRSALRRGIRNVKLYFMTGLPTETQEDVEGIVALAERVRRIMLDSLRPPGSPLPHLTISISPFVPKPHTPFQWCQMEDTKTLSEKLRLLRKKLRILGGIRVPSSSARWSAVQGVLARGDRRLAKVLYEVVRNSASWSQALKKNGLSQAFYLQRPRKMDELFPWDHLNLGVPKSRLAEQFKAISR